MNVNSNLQLAMAENFVSHHNKVRGGNIEKSIEIKTPSHYMNKWEFFILCIVMFFVILFVSTELHPHWIGNLIFFSGQQWQNDCISWKYSFIFVSNAIFIIIFIEFECRLGSPLSTFFPFAKRSESIQVKPTISNNVSSWIWNPLESMQKL